LILLTLVFEKLVFLLKLNMFQCFVLVVIVTQPNPLGLQGTSRGKPYVTSILHNSAFESRHDLKSSMAALMNSSTMVLQVHCLLAWCEPTALLSLSG